MQLKQITIGFVCFICLIFNLPLTGQSYSQAQDPLSQYFFPPELIVRCQSKIGLSPEQKKSILQIVDEKQSKFNRLNWDLRSEMETFEGILMSETISEEQALAQLDKILDLEREIKKSQVSLMIGIKNQLTSEQQQKLHKLKNP